MSYINICQIFFIIKKNISEKAIFSNAITKNVYIHSIFKQFSEKERIKYILKTIKK